MLVMQENGCILIWNKPPVTTHEELIIFGQCLEDCKAALEDHKGQQEFFIAVTQQEVISDHGNESPFDESVQQNQLLRHALLSLGHAFSMDNELEDYAHDILGVW